MGNMEVMTSVSSLEVKQQESTVDVIEGTLNQVKLQEADLFTSESCASTVSSSKYLDEDFTQSIERKQSTDVKETTIRQLPAIVSEKTEDMPLEMKVAEKETEKTPEKVVVKSGLEKSVKKVSVGAGKISFSAKKKSLF